MNQSVYGRLFLASATAVLLYYILWLVATPFLEEGHYLLNLFPDRYYAYLVPVGFAVVLICFVVGSIGFVLIGTLFVKDSNSIQRPTKLIRWKEVFFDEGSDYTDLNGFDPPSEPISIHCQATISVDVPDEGISVSALRPSASDSSNAPTPAKVQYLPPICLNLDLNPEYPSQKAPHFRLSAFWLSSQQLSLLAIGLDRIWQAQSNGPVCYEWINWLQRSLLETLQMQNEILLDRDQRSLPDLNDHRVVICSDDIHPEQILNDILQNNRLRIEKVFQEGLWTCPICMEEQSGKAFVRFESCHHYFCKECFKQHCFVNIRDGNVELRCPAVRCETLVPPDLLKKHIDPIDFDRWEKLLLSRTLDMMSDIGYCPRCNTPCLKEDDHFSQCPKCLYAFCTKCSDGYHPGRGCIVLSEKLQEAMDIPNSEQRNRFLLDLKNQVLSLEHIDKNSSPCPGCNMAIEKNGGCNHMYCIYCHTHYCHVCHAMGIDYSHFGSEACVLFDQEALNEWEQQFNQQLQDNGVVEVLRVARRDEGQQKRCPTCMTPNMKNHRNNLIRCYVCSSRYCFICQQLLPKKHANQHFGAGRCLQHTD